LNITDQQLYSRNQHSFDNKAKFALPSVMFIQFRLYCMPQKYAVRNSENNLEECLKFQHFLTVLNVL